MSAVVPVAGGVRRGVGEEQIHSVRARGSASTPRMDRMPFSAVGRIQGSAVAAPGGARKTTPLMLPT